MFKSRKPKRVLLHGSYYATDKDLGINSEVGGHDVFVIKFNKKRDRVKVKTVTSIERNSLENGQRVFKKNKKNTNYPDLIHSGRIIVMPKRDLNTDRLSGINNKGIWISKNKLMKSKFKLKYPKRFHQIIGK